MVGVIVKEKRLHHMKLYKSSFSGKDATSWLILNGGSLNVRTREDAVQIGLKLAAMNVFKQIAGGKKVEFWHIKA
jgi:hypothetical protein